ncbi:peptidylprolyl isomerase [Microbulbifer sp. OS29]|uniref:Peptidyl-prolyl cis-trans isomerase n=1 Tax=Microbulbifer okhotskensis TaxID=2926617 RepID=A0A9X2ESP6_9GAMM|nr:peptidylprolyl isomerase [Microbulbifer okhotskensis]MCO1335046.1 peptidylprolyl isomerase [Microbulbifer okhotskensis]
MRKLLTFLFCTLLSLPLFAQNPQVELKTDLGVIRIELFSKQAPITVENFLAYTDNGFYDGIIFHRVVPGFVVQAGGFTFDFQKKETRDAITNESANGLQNLRGTLSMARTNQPDSATSQFFINLIDNTRLDASEDKPGYAVFGKVIEGMDVVEKIVQKPRGIYRKHPSAPNVPIRILSAKQITADSNPVADTSKGE